MEITVTIIYEDGEYWAKIPIDDMNTGFAVGETFDEFKQSVIDAIESLINVPYTIKYDVPTPIS